MRVTLDSAAWGGCDNAAAPCTRGAMSQTDEPSPTERCPCGAGGPGRPPHAARRPIAGLTGGMVLVPQGVAFATIAGMPPEYGLYAAMVPAIVAALWGSSWHLVSGPTTAISIVVFATISPLAEPGSAAYVGWC
jgi:hypothetical protein